MTFGLETKSSNVITYFASLHLSQLPHPIYPWIYGAFSEELILVGSTDESTSKTHHNTENECINNECKYALELVIEIYYIHAKMNL